MDSLLLSINQPIGPWTVEQLLTALACIVVSFLLRGLFTRVIAHRLGALASRTETEADDQMIAALISPLGQILPAIGAYIGFRILAYAHPEWLNLGNKIFVAAATILVAWTAARMTDALATLLAERAERSETTFDDQLVPLFRKSAKVFIGLLAFLLVAQNLGYSVSGLVAGLGIGGLAVALAAKDTIANLFGSVTILIDRPFRVGDWITLQGADGVVEEIGLRSTRIRTFAKTVISIPNEELANSTVENHTLMPKRRIKFNVGVTYDATVGQMREAVARIEAYLRGNPDIDQVFMLVKFTTFSNSSLDIFVYCFTGTTDWTEHLSVKQDVNLAIMGILEDLDLQIAFPTRTVHLAEPGLTQEQQRPSRDGDDHPEQAQR